MTDVSPDPTEPAPTDLLEFPPLPKQSGGPDGPDGPGGPFGSGAPAAPGDGGIRVVPDAEATARLRIMLPSQSPTPSTALRPQAPWEDTHDDRPVLVEAFARTAASPASPSTLPSQLAAMTTATMVIPLPPSVRPGSGLLTTTLPPDHAAQANAAQIGEAFRDTIEEIFGVDFDTVDPAELGLAPRGEAQRPRPQHALGEPAGARGRHAEPGYEAPDYAFPPYPDSEYADAEYADSGHPAPDHLGSDHLGSEYGDPGYGAEAVEQYAPIPFPRAVPAEVFGGAYGVPTQQAPIGVPEPADPFGQNLRGAADPNRHALALRYLGGIFHDSSGESSYLDPEVLDRGWIPSAFGAAPPDAPTEQITRIPSLEPPRGGPTGTIAAPPPQRPRPRPQPQPQPPVPPPGRARPAGTAGPGPSAADVTAVMPAQSAPEARETRGRAGARGSHGPRRARAGSEAGHGRGRRGPGRPVAAEAKQEPEKDGGAGGRGRTPIVAGLCVAAVAALYGIALLTAGGVVGGTVPSGVSVDGVSLGGLSPAAAQQALEKQLGPAATGPIAVQVGQTPVKLDPAKAGLSLDVAGTVAAAESQRTDPFTVIPALFGVSHQIYPVVDVDQSALTAALDSLASSYDSPLVEGEITFVDGRPQVTAPREGRGFDVAAAAAAVSSGYLRASGPVVLPINTLTPRATPEALAAALEQLARPAVSAPITIVTDGVTSVLTPDQIGAALTIAPSQDGTMVATLDGDMLHADLDQAALASEQPGVDAGFTVSGGTPQLVAEKDGVGYAPSALAAAVGRVLTATTASGRTVTVPRGPLPPAFTTADAQSLGVQSVLGSATIAVPDAPDRATDMTHAASLVMGSVVQPGAMWSFNKTVGAPISPNGFEEPAGGGDASSGVDASGADDLLATAVFDAAFHAGMSDTVHHPNAVYLDRYPVGLDAAVVWPGTDMQWTNDGGHPVYVYAAYANGTVTVDMLGQSAYDSVNVTVSDRQSELASTGSPGYGCPEQSAEDGFQVDVTRVLTRSGAQVGTEQFHVTYQPFAGTRCASGEGSTGSGGATSTPGSPSSSSGGGATKGSPSGGGTGGNGGGSAPPTTQPVPAPAPSNTGVLGGLLH